MNKKQLKDKIVKAVRDLYSNKSTDNTMLPFSGVLNKFPKLHEILVELLSEQFGLFVENIDWIAPKPSTFRIELKNKNHFLLIWNNGYFLARAGGTNYNLATLSEQERAIKAIQELLIIGPIDPNKGNEAPINNNEVEPSELEDEPSEEPTEPTPEN
jgi:hypothetical protein